MLILLKLIPQEIGGHFYIIVVVVLVVYLLYWLVRRLVALLPVAEVLKPVSLFIDLHRHWSPLHLDLPDISFWTLVIPYLKIAHAFYCWLGALDHHAPSIICLVVHV